MKKKRCSKKIKQHFSAIIILNTILIVVCLILICVLIWLIVDWGFREWIHRMTFNNFWNGVFAILSGTSFVLINCGLGIYAAAKGSTTALSFIRACHLGSGLVVFLGDISVLTDAIGINSKVIHEILLELIDPSQYLNNVVKETFLRNLYRIVECCGADSFEDYTMIFHISPPEDCINYRYAGALYYEEGCSTALPRWLKKWCGGINAAIFIIFTLQVLISWRINIVRNKRQELKREVPPKPPRRSTSLIHLNVPNNRERQPTFFRPYTVPAELPSSNEREILNGSISRAKSESILSSNYPPLPERVPRGRSKPTDLISYIIKQPSRDGDGERRIERRDSRSFSRLTNSSTTSSSKTESSLSKLMGNRRTKRQTTLKLNFVLPQRPSKKSILRDSNMDSETSSSLLSENKAFETSI